MFRYRLRDGEFDVRDQIPPNIRLVSRRGLFWEGPHNFEPQSNDEDDASLSKPPRHTGGRAFGADVCSVHPARLHGCTSAESDFEPGSLRPRRRDLTTRPQRPRDRAQSKKERYSKL
ncbi:hypothetical protein AVEN_211578-1 [Araneus ventricosus]|uniref:Uncharacterized protein n=1 Tax=Araneus ventricosus TaxID=182803 RepID=A0A4Y2D825_ARAVE|nr:hypothetical protein AVEN_211578-1 [Araneus ventricosus]